MNAVNPILIKSRYKVTHIQYAQEQYAALLAVDVESRDKEEYLLNVYEGDLVKLYVDRFDRLRHCQEYQGMFMDQGALVAAFRACGGTPVDQVFYKGAEIDWETRVAFAQELFHLGLCVSDYPPEIGCAIFLSENLRLWPKEKQLAVNYQIRPLKGMNQRELAYLVMDQVKKALLWRYSSPKAEIQFLESLESQVFPTAVALYSHWMEAKAGIVADYEKLYAKPGLQRALYLFFQNVLRWGKRIWKGKRGRQA